MDAMAMGSTSLARIEVSLENLKINKIEQHLDFENRRQIRPTRFPGRGAPQFSAGSRRNTIHD
jgi:hypothetical protein